MNHDQLVLAMRPIHFVESLSYSTIALNIALLVILLLSLLLMIRRVVRQPLLRWRQQRLALSELAVIKKRYDTDKNHGQLARDLSTLLRRYALVRFPDPEIAGLSGQRWLNFLDQHGSTNFFSSECGSVLITAPYQANLAINASALLSQVRRWIKANR